MCSDCGDEPMCGWCGTDCFGRCGDPDCCPSCWTDRYMGISLEEMDEEENVHDECMDEDCHCLCHDEMYAGMGVRWEAGVFIDGYADGPLYDRKGVFRFRELPSEIRDKIYGYAFLQEGVVRKNLNHRGSIHTNLLRTCRQVYKEAGHLPLTINQMCFNCPAEAHDFIGFSLAPTISHLFTKLSVEFHVAEWFGINTNLLWKRLKTLPVAHLSVTLKGPYGIEVLKGHCCFTNALKEIKTLTSFDIKLVSSRISKAQNEEVQEDLRIKLIEGYVPSNKKKSETKSAGKRKGKEDCKVKPAPKRAKKASSKGSKTPKAGNKMCRARDDMLVSYEAMKTFAASLERGTAAVKIRLDEALEAAESQNQAHFEKLAQSISSTLEELFAKTNDARMAMVKASGALGSASKS